MKLTNKNIFIKSNTKGHDLNVPKGMREHLVANNCFIQIEKSDMGLILTILGKYKDFKLGYG
mgnify:CR=1 FL=1